MSCRVAFRGRGLGGRQLGCQVDGLSRLSVSGVDSSARGGVLSQLLEENGAALESGGAVDGYCTVRDSLESAVLGRAIAKLICHIGLIKVTALSFFKEQQ